MFTSNGNMDQRQLLDTCNRSFNSMINSTWAGACVALVLIVNLFMYLAFLHWTKRIQSSGSDDAPCDCSKDWRSEFVKWYPPIALLVTVILVWGSHAGLIQSVPIASTLAIMIITGFIVASYAGSSFISNMISEGYCPCARKKTIQNNAEEAVTSFKLSLVLASTLTLGILLAILSHKMSGLF